MDRLSFTPVSSFLQHVAWVRLGFCFWLDRFLWQTVHITELLFDIIGSFGRVGSQLLQWIFVMFTIIKLIAKGWLSPLTEVPTTRLVPMTWLVSTVGLVPLVGFFPDWTRGVPPTGFLWLDLFISVYWFLYRIWFLVLLEWFIPRDGSYDRT